MSFSAYVWRWLVRAISGTFGAVSTLATFTSVLASIVVSFVPEAPPRLADVLLQVTVLFGVVLGCRLIAAPYWMHRDVEAHLRRLAQENETLRTPHASLTPLFRHERPFWIAPDRLYRVGVRNDGEAVAERVRVRFIDILPINPLDSDPLPSPIGRKGGGTDRVTINPGETDYFDLIQDVSVGDVPGFITQCGPRTLELYLEQASHVQFELDPATRYEFVLSVTAANAEPASVRFSVRHPLDGELEVVLADG